MDSIRIRLRQQAIATAIALAALFIAVGGGALVANAAKLITGDQIAPNAIRSKHVKDGSLQKKDFAKGQLPRGRTGPPGPFPSGDLPKGKTIRGNFYAADRGDAGSVDGVAYSDISFGFQLASAPTVEFRLPGSAATTGCPGSVSDPQAAAGTLCIYVAGANYLVNTIDPTTGTTGAANRWGTNLYIYNSSTNASASGTWAVTSP
jgi:hypothetical protein